MKKHPGIERFNALFGKGKIAKKKSQSETEPISALTDPVAAANRAMRICMENNRAVARPMHQSNDPDATPIPPVVTPAPYNPAPAPYVPNIVNGELEEIGSDVESVE